MSLEAGRSAEAPALPSRRYANFVLAMLFAAAIMSFLDRQLMAILLPPIQAELGVSDTAMGFLTGFAYSAIYAILGLPIARWADRGVRRSIIALGLAIWSIMTAACGLARGFWTLAAARFGVGIGEAHFLPPSHSLLTDYFPLERRATALAIFTGGSSVGIVIGLMGGGALADLVGWRWVFVIAGVPGVLLAIALRLTVREPSRSHLEPEEPWRDVLRYLVSLRSVRHIAMASGLHVFAGYGAGTWTPTFVHRVHGLSLTETGFWMGLIGGGGAALGALLGGFLADRLARRDVRWYMWLPAISTTLAIPFVYGFLLLPDIGVALAVFTPAAAVGAMWSGPTFAMIQSLAKPRMRALAAAMVLFMFNFVGFGLGPLAVGWLNDLLAPRFGVESIRYSLLIILIPALWAAVHNLLAARSLAHDLQRTAAASGESVGEGG